MYCLHCYLANAITFLALLYYRDTICKCLHDCSIRAAYCKGSLTHGKHPLPPVFALQCLAGASEVVHHERLS